jgi:hypothetical protein
MQDDSDASFRHEKPTAEIDRIYRTNRITAELKI